MNRPPLLMSIRICNENHKHRIFIPLPLFLLLPLLLFIVIILIPIVFVATIVLWYKGWGFYGFRVMWIVINMYCAITGFKVDVRNVRERVTISIR